jgi:hypothetical protein
LGEYKDLAYTISYPIKKNYNIKSGNRVAALADGVNSIVKQIGKFGLSKEMRRHLDPLYPKIKEATVEGKVVLVVVQLKQWKSKSGAGDMMQMVFFAYISAIADSRHFAFNMHKSMEKHGALKPAPPKGWVYGKPVFLWFEDEEKRQKEAKHDKGNLYWESIQ